MSNCYFSSASTSESSKKMAIDLYYTPESTEARTVRLVAAALGVSLNLKLVNMTTGENMKPEFTKMNIMHSVPVMDDNGFYLSESRAIIFYFVQKYAKNTKLFPEDIRMRGLIWERMFFDFGMLYQSFVNYYFPVIYEGMTFDSTRMMKMTQAFEFLDKFLMDREYLTGTDMTIADLTTVVTVSNFEYVGFNFSKFKNVMRWYNNMKTVAPMYKEANEDGVKIFAKIAAPFLKH